MEMEISTFALWRSGFKTCYIASMPPAHRKKETLFFFMLFLLLSAVFYYKLIAGGILYVFPTGDGWNQNYPLRAFYSAQLKHFHVPLWNPYEFAGIPYIGAMQTGALYPINLIAYFLLQPATAFNLNIIFHCALAGFFTFIFLRESGRSRLASATAGMLFCFSGYLATVHDDTAIQNTSVWLPLVLYTIERMRKAAPRAEMLRWAAALALSVAVQALAGNFQIFMYSMAVALFYFLYALPEAPKASRPALLICFGLGLGLAAAISSVQIWPTLELSRISVRDHIAGSLGTFFSHAYHMYPKDIPSALFPFLYRGDLGRKLLRPEDSVSFYIGILPLALAVSAAIKGFRTSRWTSFWSVLAVFALVLSMGTMTPLGALLVHMPVYGLFRAHGRNIFELSFAVSVLFAEGIDGAMRRRGDSRLAMLLLLSIPAVWAALLVCSFFAQPGFLGAFTPGNSAVTFSLAMSVLYIICLALFEKIKLKPFFWAALVLAAFETVRIFAPYEITGKPLAGVKKACAGAGYQTLQKTESAQNPFRVMNIFSPELINVTCGQQVFNSYDQLELDDYAYLFDVDPMSYTMYSDELISGNSILSMAGVKWIAIKQDQLAGLGYPLEAGLRASTGVSKEVALGSDDSPKIIPPPDDKTKDTISFSPGMKATPGTYLLTFSAMALQKGASLRAEFSDENKPYRFTTIPLYTYPGVLGRKPRTFHRVLFHPDSGPVSIFLSAPLRKEVEITGITLSKLEPGGPLPISVKSGDVVYRKAFETTGWTYFENLNALPKAYMVRGIVPVSGLEQTKYLLETGQINPAVLATVSSREMDGGTQTAFSGGTASITHYGLEDVDITASAGQAGGFLVLADQFYPGWQAYTDGKSTKIYRTDGVMRGIIVPPGAHKVRFVYRPQVFYALSVLSGFTFLACLGVLLPPRRK